MTNEAQTETIGTLLKRIQTELTKTDHDRRLEALTALEILRDEVDIADVTAPTGALLAFPTEPRPPRTNAMFLLRPAFLDDGDYWELVPDAENGGWRAPAASGQGAANGTKKRHPRRNCSPFRRAVS